MKNFFDILKEIMPIWLALITLAFGYLIFLYTKIFKQTNQLAEKQANYLKDRVDTVDKTTNIFERTVKHQETDLNRLYELNQQLQQKMEKQKDIELKNLDEQLKDITDSLKSLNENQISKQEFDKIRSEISITKSSTVEKYDALIKDLNNTEKRTEVSKLKKAFVIMPYSEDSNNNYNIIKEVFSNQGLETVRADEVISAGQSISEKIKELISKSDIIICDVTGNNPNVMYELGFAHGINKPVILIASNINELRIDIANYRIIIVDKNQKSREQLSKGLTETLEEIRKDSRRKKLIELRDVLIDQLPLGDYLNMMHRLLPWI